MMVGVLAQNQSDVHIRLCEERSDAAIHSRHHRVDCFASLAKTIQSDRTQVEYQKQHRARPSPQMVLPFAPLDPILPFQAD